MICQSCGVEAPTRHVDFYQNIGALIMRYTSRIEGNLCKSCIHKHFWKFTLVNMTLGWWGMISLIMTPCFLINNLVRYMTCLFMPSSQGATRPQLTPDAVARLGPHTEEIIRRLNAGENAPGHCSPTSPRVPASHPARSRFTFRSWLPLRKRAAK